MTQLADLILGQTRVLDSKTLVLLITATIGSLAVFLVVAALQRIRLAEARTMTYGFLRDWGALAPLALHSWLRLALGCSTAFALLVALSFAFDRMGEVAMPYAAKSIGFIGNPAVRWSETNHTDWSNFRDRVRNKWGKVFPNEDLKSEDAWEKFKVKCGKDDVRWTRIMWCYSLLLLVAGGTDVLRRVHFRRGLVCVALGFIVTLGTTAIWIDRKAHYVFEFVRHNEYLGVESVEVPPILETQPT